MDFRFWIRAYRVGIFAVSILVSASTFTAAAEPCITHEFVSGAADDEDTTKLRPSDWDACHVEPPKPLTFIIGCPTCPVLTDDDDYPFFWLNETERTLTILRVTCRSNAGTPTVQLIKDDGTPENILSTALECSTSGANTTSFASGENVIAPDNWIGSAMVDAGVATNIAVISIRYTVNP